MIYILLDIGNTLTKTAVISDGKLKHRKPFKTTDLNKMVCLFDQKFKKNVKIVVSTGKKTSELNKFLKNAIFLTPQIIPIKTKYNIKEIGIDRMLSAYGTLQKFAPPFVIISLGTATTIDYVNINKEFCGGIISLGICKSLNTLKSINSKFSIKQLFKATFPALSTQNSLINGVICSINGLIKEFMLKNKISQKTKIILTGGESESFVKHLKGFNIHLEKKLVIESILHLLKSYK